LDWGTALRVGGWMLAVAVALTGTTWVLREGLFYGVDELAIVAGLIVIAYGVFAVVRGRLAGLDRFKAYGLVSASESVIRLALAAVVALTVATTRALGWIMPFGALAAAAWWLVVGRRRGELIVHEPAVAPPRASRFLGLTTATNAAVQVLLAGAPLVVVALGAGPAEVSVVFVTMTAARVPVVLALGGLLSRLLPTFVRILEERGDAAAARVGQRILLSTLAVAVVGAVAGGLVGGPLIALFFGAEFTPAWWFAGATGAGVLLATGGMLLNQMLIARGLEHRLPGPWYIGLAAASVTVVLAGGSPSARVAAAFVVGELVAVVALVIAARRPSPRLPEIQ
jgi:O-antigen/teichoic acid export membrane protein